jgi:GT2 family glycosyltransferase
MKPYRVKNFRNYIEYSNEIEIKYNICIIILCYNNIDYIKLLIDKISNNKIDYLFIDNNSNDNTINYLIDNHKFNFNILRLKHNEGGAGGFAIGQEWVMERGYKYCILSEDDAIPENDILLKSIIDEAKEDTIVQTKYNGLNNQFFTLHFVLYPTEIFKYAGVIDSRYFFRYDDYEYGYRLQKHFDLMGYIAININQKYNHPYLKRGFGIMPIYFSIRNSMFIYSKLGKLFLPLKIIFVYFNFSFNQIIFRKNHKPLILVLLSLFDFLLHSFKRNQQIVRNYKYEVVKPSYYQELITKKINDFKIEFRNYNLKTNLLSNLPSLFADFKYNKFNYNYCILGKYASPNSSIFVFFKKVLFIEEINLEDQTISYLEIDYNKKLINILLYFLALILSLIVIVSITPMVFISSFILFVLNKNKYGKFKNIILFSREWDTNIKNV